MSPVPGGLRESVLMALEVRGFLPPCGGAAGHREVQAQPGTLPAPGAAFPACPLHKRAGGRRKV